MALSDGQGRAQWPDGVADWVEKFGVLGGVVRVGDVSVQRAGLLGGGAATRFSPRDRLQGLNGPVCVVDVVELDFVVIDRSIVGIEVVVVLVVDVDVVAVEI